MKKENQEKVGEEMKYKGIDFVKKRLERIAELEKLAEKEPHQSSISILRDIFMEEPKYSRRKIEKDQMNHDKPR